jgi:hypothetical protein
MIIQKPTPDLRANTIAAAVKRVGQLLNCTLTLELEGSVEVIEPLSASGDSRLPYLKVSSFDERVLTLLKELTIQINRRYIAPDGTYEAYFSCLLPRNLASLEYVSYSKWKLGTEVIDFDVVTIDRPDRLFLKGILSNAEEREFRSSHWSSMTINILKPSLVKPNLARSETDLSGIPLKDAWDDAAVHLRGLLEPYLTSASGSAKSLSAAMEIVHLPESSLPGIVAREQWPLWILEPDTGFFWHAANEVCSSQEVLEAPDEMRYLLGRDEHFQTTLAHARSWRGPSCFVTLNEGSYGAWWTAASCLAHTVLETRGFVPVGIQLVYGDSDDDVPLACTTWRRSGRPRKLSSDLSFLLAEWRKDPMMPYPRLMATTLAGLRRRGGLELSPRLVRFPDNMNSVAAIGSLYWNQANTKIQALVEFLLQLSIKYSERVLHPRIRRAFDLATDAAYLGYAVAARHSDFKAAIGRYSSVLNSAAEEGMAVPAPLIESDFYQVLLAAIGIRITIRFGPGTSQSDLSARRGPNPL